MTPAQTTPFGSTSVLVSALGTVGSTTLLTQPEVLAALGMRLDVAVTIGPMFIGALAILGLPAQKLPSIARWRLTRELAAAAVLATGSIYGASSTLPLSPTWGFIVPVAYLVSLLGIDRLPRPMLLSALFGPLFRWLFVPHVHARELALALLLSSVEVVLAWLFGRWRDDAARLAVASHLSQSEAKEREAALAPLSLAMSIHDSLSGLVLGVQLTLKRALVWADARPGVDAVISAVHEQLDEPARLEGGVEGTLLHELERIRAEVEAVGATLDVRLDARTPLAPRDTVDLLELLREAALNAARHAPGSVVTVRVRVDALALRIECRSAAATGPHLSGAGRGLRNMRLRTWARGGSLHFELNDIGGRLSIEWPRGGRRVLPLELAVLGMALVVGALLAALSGFWQAVLPIGAVMAYSGALVAASIVLVAFFERRRAPLDDQRREAERVRLRASIEGPLRALELAAANESLEGARAAMRNLATELASVLAELERDAVPSAPAATPPGDVTLPFFEDRPQRWGFNVVQLAAAFAIVGALASDVTLELLDLPSTPVRLVCALFALDLLLWARFSARLGTAHFAAPLRVISVLTRSAMAFAFGALSSRDLGIGWLLAPTAALLNATFGTHRYRWLQVLLGLEPIVLRLIFVDDPSPRSLLIAAGVGFFNSSFTWLLGQRADEIDALRTRAPLQSWEPAARAAIVDRLTLAAEVHDGLAALVLSARVALAKKGLESTHEHLDRLLRRASELLEAPSGPLGGELASVLHNFESDAPGQISHQVTTGAELRLVIRAPREVLERGRGVRSARLRAWARGGTVRREGDTLVVCWLSKVPRTSSNSSRISLGVLACGAVVSFASGLVQVAAISAGISVLCFVLYRSMELPARRDQALSAREFARSRLEPSLAALRAARSTSSAEHVGAALNTLSHSIVDVVHELEAAPRYTSLPALTLH